MRALPMLTLLLAASACSSRLEPQPDSLPLDGVFRVELDASAARVELVAAETLSVDGNFAWRNERTKPEVSYLVEDRILRISSFCDRPWPRCGATHTLAVPDDIRVVVDLDEGQLLARGVANLEVDARDAEVVLDGLIGQATVRATDSVVEGVQLATDTLDIAADGFVSLRFDQPGDSVRVVAPEASLRVPAGPYRLNLRSDAGEIEVDGVFHTDDAATLLDVETAGLLSVVGD